MIDRKVYIPCMHAHLRITLNYGDLFSMISVRANKVDTFEAKTFAKTVNIVIPTGHRDGAP